ncbi:hypothetical protein C8J57DRAFT_1527670 [Mycena rebaudengoi]|nr:hypothetical protein C8J57DRAFT_1527670 [Mycena rebaudengoi]
MAHFLVTSRSPATADPLTFRLKSQSKSGNLMAALHGRLSNSASQHASATTRSASSLLLPSLALAGSLAHADTSFRHGQDPADILYHLLCPSSLCLPYEASKCRSTLGAAVVRILSAAWSRRVMRFSSACLSSLPRPRSPPHASAAPVTRRVPERRQAGAVSPNRRRRTARMSWRPPPVLHAAWPRPHPPPVWCSTLQARDAAAARAHRCRHTRALRRVPAVRTGLKRVGGARHGFDGGFMLQGAPGVGRKREMTAQNVEWRMARC